jgi:hypothetical protein
MKKYDIEVRDKRAVVEQNDIGYAIEFYFNGRIYSKTTVQSLNEAVEIADSWVDTEPDTPILLSE